VTPLNHIGDDTPYVEKEHCCQVLESQLTLQGPFLLRLSASARALAPWGIEHHPNTQLSSGYGSDIICKELRHNLKRLAF